MERSPARAPYSAIGELQRLLEPAAQPLAVVEGAAQKQHFAGDLPPLSQTSNGLVHHRLVNTGGNILVAGTLVEQGLDIRFGKHAAPGGNRIEPLAPQTQLIQLVRRYIQQRGHLVDKRAGAAGTGTVHPLVNTAVEKDDLGIFSPQLNDHRGIRLQLLDHLAGGKNLLDKGYAGSLGKAQSGRTGDSRRQRSVPRQRGCLRQ